MKVCIFSNDPIIEYFNKGEIKERYYNPNNIFDEVNIISTIKKDIEESGIRLISQNGFGTRNSFWILILTLLTTLRKIIQVCSAGVMVFFLRSPPS